MFFEIFRFFRYGSRKIYVSQINKRVCVQESYWKKRQTDGFMALHANGIRHRHQFDTKLRSKLPKQISTSAESDPKFGPNFGPKFGLS